MKSVLKIVIVISIIAGITSCGKKKKPLFWLLGLSDQTEINSNTNNTTTSEISNGLSISYDNNDFTSQQNPDGAFEGVVLAGPDDNTNTFGSSVPSCADVSCLLDRILSTISNWSEIATNGYSLNNRQILSSSLFPTETADLQLTFNNSYTANEVRNQLIALIGTVDGSGNVSNFPGDPPGATLDTTFRVIIQTTQDSSGNAIILVGVTTASNYSNVEDELASFTDGTNVGPSNDTPSDYIDTLLADNPPKADFLFVIDNSGSMSQEQTAVKNNALRFFDRLNQLGVDFKIGTITTDSSTLRGNGFTSDRIQFEQDVQVGLKGSGKESCTYYAEKALSNSSPNNRNAVLTNGNGSLDTIASAGYPRSGSSLAVICVTDESDAYSKWDGSGSNTDAPRFDITNNLFISNQITYYAIMPLNNNGQYGSCSGTNGKANVYYNFSSSVFPVAALNIKSLAEQTGGSVSSICGENYGAFLEQLADQVAAKATSYQLSRIPISATMKVYLNGVEIPRTSSPATGTTGYKYISSENKIVFTGKLPVAGTQIQIAYQSYQ